MTHTKPARPTIAVLFLLQCGFATHRTAAQTKSDSITSAGSLVSVRFGFRGYDMTEFNAKLDREGNRGISGGMQVGLEVAALRLNTRWGTFAAPLAVEYFRAGSNTSHTSGDTITVVDWRLSVLGVVIAPALSFSAQKARPSNDASWLIVLRPAGVGYYSIGRLGSAGLNVSGVPGHLNLEGDAVGASSHVGVEHRRGSFGLLIEGGYMWLTFDDVTRTPQDGWAQPGVTSGASKLPEALSYSGPSIRFRVSTTFGSK